MAFVQYIGAPLGREAGDDERRAAAQVGGDRWRAVQRLHARYHRHAPFRMYPRAQAAELLKAAGDEDLYVLTCFSDRDKLLSLTERNE